MVFPKKNENSFPALENCDKLRKEDLYEVLFRKANRFFVACRGTDTLCRWMFQHRQCFQPAVFRSTVFQYAGGKNCR
jgi:hypothetical protein